MSEFRGGVVRSWALIAVAIAVCSASLWTNVGAVEASEFDYGALNSMFDGLRAADKQQEVDKERVIGGLSKSRLEEINKNAINRALKLAEFDAATGHSLLELDGSQGPSERVLRKAKTDPLDAGLDAVTEGLSEKYRAPDVVYRLDGREANLERPRTCRVLPMHGCLISAGMRRAWLCTLLVLPHLSRDPRPLFSLSALLYRKGS